MVMPYVCSACNDGHHQLCEKGFTPVSSSGEIVMGGSVCICECRKKVGQDGNPQSNDRLREIFHGGMSS